MIQTTEHLTAAELERFQLDKLRQFVEYAWRNTTGYRRHWERAGFDPSQLKTLGDLTRIPMITKCMLRDNYQEFSNSSLPGARYVTTGGSTGIPFGFLQDKDNQATENGFTFAIWSMQYPEVRRKHTSTILRGGRLTGLYEIDLWGNLYLSSYDISLENVARYVELINRQQTCYLQAYPSALYLMARIISDHSLPLRHRFQFLSLASEPLYDFQEALIRRVFGTRLCTHYGATERVVVAANCEHERRLHVFPQYGITEVLKADGTRASEGERGEIVGTSFWNFATPFIRYRTMDFAQVGPSSCSNCKRNYQLLDRLDGRLQEFIVGRSRKLVSMTAINMHDTTFDALKQFRFLQEKTGEVIFQYVPKTTLSEHSKNHIRANLEFKLKEEFNLKLREVDAVPLTQNGKLRFLDQRLDMQQYIDSPASGL